MTDEEIKNLAEIILQEEEEFMLPILKLYELIKAEKEKMGFEPDYFIDLLKRDQRFKVFESQSTQEPWPEEDDETMLELGYYKGPRVMLASRIPTKEEMKQAITERMQKTLDSLKQAYKVKPENMTDDEEEEFLEVMKKTKDLQKKLDEAFDKKESTGKADE